MSPPARALLVQHDLFDAHEFVAVLPISAQRVSAPLLRVDVGRDQQAMVDQLRMIRRRDVDRALALHLGLVR